MAHEFVFMSCIIISMWFMNCSTSYKFVHKVAHKTSLSALLHVTFVNSLQTFTSCSQRFVNILETFCKVP